MVERIIARAPSGSWLRTALVNVMLKCCQIRVIDMYIRLQFINDLYTCMLKVDDFSLVPQFRDQCSLFRGLADLLHTSGEESVLIISCSCMELGLKRDEYASWISSFTGLSACVKLNNLQPLGYGACILDANVKISPAIISILLVLLDVLSFKELKRERNGQELWKLAAEKTAPWNLTLRHSLYKVVNVVLIWLRYVRVYVSLLQMIGYHADKSFKGNLAMISRDRKRLSLLKYRWQAVHQLEEKLPAEAVACARQIARKNALCQLDLLNIESNSGFKMFLPMKLVSLLLLFWKIIRFVLSAVQHFFLGNVSSASQDFNVFPVLGGVVPEFQFSFSLGEVRMTLSHADTDNVIISKELESGAVPTDMKLPSFCFIITCLCLDYAEDIITTFFLALGELKLCLLSSPMDSLSNSVKRGERSQPYRGLKHDNDDISDIIMWGEPALLSHPLEDVVASCSDTVDRAMVFTLENSVRDLWSNWKNISRRHEEIDVKDRPFALFELKKFLVDPYTRDGGDGLLKCSLVLGKLNCDLEFSFMISTFLLIKQIQLLHQVATNVETQVFSHSSNALLENSLINGELESFTNRGKITMFNTIPLRNIQIGVLVSGSSIRISSQDKSFRLTGQNFPPLITQGSPHCSFVLDTKEIEFVVWPASKIVLSQSPWEMSFDEAASEYLWCKEPRKVDIPKSRANENFFCHGHSALNVCLKFTGLSMIVDDLEVNQQSPIIELMPVTLHCSTYRYLFSFNLF